MSAEALHAELSLDSNGGLLVDSLTESEAARLHDAIQQAQRHRRTELEREFDKILRTLPPIVRGRARRILLGAG